MEAKYTDTCDKVLKEEMKMKKNNGNFELHFVQNVWQR